MIQQKMQSNRSRTGKSEHASAGVIARSARDYALSVLERSDRTEQELRRKLHDRGYEQEEIEETIAFLKEYYYVDDVAYAGKYARACSSRKSIRQIRFDLERKGVDRSLIDTALEETEVDEEAQIRAFLLKKGFQPGERMDTAVCRKLTGSLSRKGFSYEAIRNVMVRMCEEFY